MRLKKNRCGAVQHVVQMAAAAHTIQCALERRGWQPMQSEQCAALTNLCAASDACGALSRSACVWTKSHNPVYASVLRFEADATAPHSHVHVSQGVATPSAAHTTQRVSCVCIDGGGGGGCGQQPLHTCTAPVSDAPSARGGAPAAPATSAIDANDEESGVVVVVMAAAAVTYCRNERRKWTRLAAHIDALLSTIECDDTLSRYVVTELATYVAAVHHGWALCSCWRQHEWAVAASGGGGGGDRTLTTYTRGDRTVFTDRHESDSALVSYCVCVRTAPATIGANGVNADDATETVHWCASLSEMNERVRAELRRT